MQLGKLKEIDIRKVWQHEQYDFSKWLSSENNLKDQKGRQPLLELTLDFKQLEQLCSNYIKK